MYSILYFFLPILASTQDVDLKVQVKEITELSIGGSPPILAITKGKPGDTVLETSVSTSVYSYTSNGNANKKIVGQIDTDMPKDTALYVQLEAPDQGATQSSPLPLSTSPVNLALVPGKSRAKNLAIYYTFAVKVSAGALTSFSRKTVYTLTDL